MPVISPAPLSTATPAASGCARRVSGAAGRIAVTPVRATPRPAGGSGSSRTTVTWPTPTPATSAIESAGPGSSSPIRRPSARRLRAASIPRTLTGGYARAPWPSRCPSSGATGTDCTTRAARSGSACASPAPSCPRAPTRSAPRWRARARASSTPQAHDDDALLAVHDARAARVPGGRVARLGGGGLPRDPGQDRVVPYVFAAPGPRRRPARRVPAAPSARAGLLRLRHDDAHRPGHVGGGARGGRRGA